MEIRHGTKVEVTRSDSLKGPWYEGRVVRCMRKTNQVSVQYDHLVSKEDPSKPLRETVDLANVRQRPLSLEEEGLEFEIHERVEAFYRDGWWVGVIVDKDPETSRYVVFFPDSDDKVKFDRSLLRVFWKWDGFKWVSASSSSAAEAVQELEGQDSVGERLVQAGNTEDEIGGKSLDSSKRKTLHGEMNSLLPQKKSRKEASAGISSPLTCSVAIDDESLNEGAKQQRARTEGNLEVNENHKYTRAEEQISNVHDEQLHEKLCASQLDELGTPGCSWDKDHQEPESLNLTDNPPIAVLEEIPIASIQLQREEIISEGQNGCLHQSSEDQRKQTNIKKSTAMDLSCQSSSSKNTILPFVKSSPSWKTVESTELFITFPQSPHYSPLWQEKEVLREGMALGFMVAFADVVDTICKLQLRDDRNIFEDKLKAIIEFEGPGFNIQPLRARLEEMLQLKNSFLQLEDKLTNAEKQILDQLHEKDHICKEIDTIDRDIATLQEKKASVIEMKEKTETDIKQLQHDVQLMKQASHDYEEDFKKVAAGLLSQHC